MSRLLDQCERKFERPAGGPGLVALDLVTWINVREHALPDAHEMEERYCIVSHGIDVGMFGLAIPETPGLLQARHCGVRSGLRR